jgi:hypothetical protein
MTEPKRFLWNPTITLRARETAICYDPFFFAPRWISRYLVESIRQTGDISIAFDLMLKDKWCFARMDLSQILPCEKCLVRSECYNMTFGEFLRREMKK